MRVILSDSECRFVWKESTPCAESILQVLQRTSPRGGAAVTAVLGKKALEEMAPGAAEADMARQHISPALAKYLAEALSSGDANLLRSAQDGVVEAMGEALSELTGVARSLPAMSFLLSEGSYRAYTTLYAQANFNNPEAREYPVSFSGFPVFCLPGLKYDYAYLDGAVSVVCGPGEIVLDDATGLRTFVQFIRLELKKDQVLTWKTV